LCWPAKQMWFLNDLSYYHWHSGWLSLLARFTPFREEHTRHQGAVRTPSSGSPPVIKQEQTIIHRRERGLFSSLRLWGLHSLLTSYLLQSLLAQPSKRN
jgi:hypothetical protein